MRGGVPQKPHAHLTVKSMFQHIHAVDLEHKAPCSVPCRLFAPLQVFCRHSRTSWPHVHPQISHHVVAITEKLNGRGSRLRFPRVYCSFFFIFETKLTQIRLLCCNILRFCSLFYMFHIFRRAPVPDSATAHHSTPM